MAEQSTIEITKEAAVAKAESGWWKTATPHEIVEFQLFCDRLCMDFPAFHAAVETVLGRSIWTHEFADPDSLRAEFLKQQPAPNLEMIMAKLPADKPVVVLDENGVSLLDRSNPSY